MGKGENAGDQNFLLFSQCFQKRFFAPPGWLDCHMSDSWPGDCELRRTFFLAYFHLSLLLAEACEKSSWWFWKEHCVSTGVRKPGNTCASPTAMIMTLSVKVVLNSNPSNEPPDSLLPKNYAKLRYAYLGFLMTISMKFCWNSPIRSWEIVWTKSYGLVGQIDGLTYWFL